MAPRAELQAPLQKWEILSPKRVTVGQGSFMNQVVRRTRQHLLTSETAWNSQKRAQCVHRTEAGPGGSAGKNRLPMQETWVRSLIWEDPWRRKWQPTPVFLPWKSHGQRSLVGYSLWGLKELDMT